MQRSRSPAVLLSVVLHIGVGGALLWLGIKGDAPGSSTPAILYAELVELDRGSARAAEARNQLPTVAPAEKVEPVEPVEPQQSVAAPDSPASAAAVAVSQDIAPAPNDSATDVRQEPEVAVANEAVADRAEPAAPDPTAPAERSRLLAEEPRPEPAAQSAPPSRPVADPQHRMLSAKFASWTGQFTAEQPARTVAWKHDGQEYTAVLRQMPPDDEMGLGHVLVEISTEENGNRISSEMRMRRLAFSSFAQFVDRWDPQVQIHADEVDGRFHSNSEIHLLASRGVKPIFHGRVTTASPGIRTDSSGRFDRAGMFLGGLETGVRRIVLPQQFVPFRDDAAVDADRIKRFEEATRLTFYSDGTYGWRHAESSGAEQKVQLPESPYYIVGPQDEPLHVRGIVKGKVLIYSPERIVIEDDLTYAHYPNVSADAEDFLGLVSGRSIEVAPPEVTGPGDVSITASIYAKRQFAVKNYRARENATLLIYGSLTAGTITATEPRFATKIQFDERLETMRPPSFPMSDRYELEAWDGRWKIEPGAAQSP